MSKQWLLTKSKIDNVLYGLFGHSPTDPVKITTGMYAVSYDRTDIDEPQDTAIEPLSERKGLSLLPFPDTPNSYPISIKLYSQALSIYNQNVAMLGAAYRAHAAKEPPYSFELAYVETNAHKAWQREQKSLIDKLYEVEAKFFEFDEPPPPRLERSVPSLDVLSAVMYWYANLENKFQTKRCLIDCHDIVTHLVKDPNKLKIKKNFEERICIYKKILDDCITRVRIYAHKALYILLNPNSAQPVDLDQLALNVNANLSGGETSSDTDNDLFREVETDASSSDPDPDTTVPDEEDVPTPPTSHGATEPKP